MKPQASCFSYQELAEVRSTSGSYRGDWEVFNATTESHVIVPRRGGNTGRFDSPTRHDVIRIVNMRW